MQFTESYLRSTQRSSSRERSTQLVTREMQQSLIRSFHQSSIKHSFRESSIARNFLRQSSSSSSQSEVQEISEISENFYSRQSSSSEKKSTLRQSFQFRFSKFYQSSQLSKQFYRSSFVSSSSLVSSRFLSHEYSSSISSRSFVSSSLSSVNQSIKTSDTDYDRELINLTKLYSDETKYSEENDNFSFKLIMFNDMYDRVDVSSETKLKTFLTMLKRLALNYYYANVISNKTSFTFDDVYISMTNYFEDAEYKKNILNK
jgi:Tfp pilus assembly protein PilE